MTELKLDSSLLEIARLIIQARRKLGIVKMRGEKKTHGGFMLVMEDKQQIENETAVRLH